MLPPIASHLSQLTPTGCEITSIATIVPVQVVVFDVSVSFTISICCHDDIMSCVARLVKVMLVANRGWWCHLQVVAHHTLRSVKVIIPCNGCRLLVQDWAPMD